MTSEVGSDERAALAKIAGSSPECCKFLADMLGQMVGEDEEKWQMVLEFSGNQLNDTALVAWVDSAECGIELIVYLLYDCGESPQGLLSIVNGGV